MKKLILALLFVGAAHAQVVHAQVVPPGPLPAGVIVNCDIVTCLNFPGGGGSPGGTNGQPQYNNMGSFGGFTMAGDCVITVPNIVCTKTNGVAFVASATTDTTNAANISSGTLPAARLPNPSASTLGGTQSITATAHQYLTSISTSGVPAKAQPACGDLSDAAASCNTDATNASNISSGTLAAARLAVSGVTAASYTSANITVDATGRVTAASNGSGASFANPTATAGPTAVNGSATTSMRSDAAPAVQKASSSQFGIVETDASTISNSAGVISCTTGTTSQLGCLKPDGTTITVSAGVITASGGSATSITPGTTTVSGATAPCLIDNSASTTMGCAAIGNGLAVSSGTIGTNVPRRTVTTSPTVAAGDMGGVIYSNVSGGGTVTIPAISSTVFATGMSLSLVNYSASTAAISTTPTVNAGGGCVTATGIPTGDTWELVSNGTTIDCNQTISAGGGNVSNTGTPTSGQFAEWTSSTVIGGQTMGGDCTLSTATITCTKTNGTALSALATTTPGSGVATALGDNVGSAGAFVTNGGALGTPSGGTATNITGLPIGGIAAMAADTLAANATGGSASPTAVAIPSTMMAYLQASTKFTESPTGCTPSATTGGPFGGTITLASGPCTSLVITMNGATGYTANAGYHCSVGDKTTQNAGTWIPEWGETASSTTTATIPIPGAAGATDVITFDCRPY